MPDYTGKIVEFLSSGDLKLAFVDSHAKSKVQMTDINGKNVSIAPRNIVIVHDSTEKHEFSGQAHEVLSRIQSEQEEVDTELLWESLEKGGAFLSPEQLSREYFGETSPTRESAVFRAVMQDRIRFKMKGLEFQPRPAEQVEEQLHAIEVQSEREALLLRRNTFLTRVLEATEQQPVDGEFEPLLDQIESYLLGTPSLDVEKMLSQLDSESSPKETAFQLLVRTGRLPEDTDPLLLIAGIEEHFPPEVIEVCGRMEPFHPNSERLDLTRLEAFSIDDPETQEVDDALTIEPLDKGWRVGIHIADVAAFIDSKHRLFEEAQSRVSTLYLPDRTVTLFPQRLSFDLASLQEGEVRPALTFLIEFGDSGLVEDWTLRRSQIKVAKRLTYDQADDFWTASGRPITGLVRLRQFADTLRKERQVQGAVVIPKPEIKVRVDAEGEVSLKVIEETPSRSMISELMILANRLSAEFAQRHGLPFLYRAQPPPAEPLQVPDEYDPLPVDQALRKMKKSQIILEAKPHYALGLGSYAQISSPIRRLTDLVCQQQVTAHLEGRPLPHDEDSLKEIQVFSELKERDLRAVERKSNRHFTLQYFERHLKKEELEVVVLRQLANGYLVETVTFYARGKLLSSKELALGQRLGVRIDKVDPREDVLTFRETIVEGAF